MILSPIHLSVPHRLKDDDLLPTQPGRPAVSAFCNYKEYGRSSGSSPAELTSLLALGNRLGRVRCRSLNATTVSGGDWDHGSSGGGNRTSASNTGILVRLGASSHLHREAHHPLLTKQGKNAESAEAALLVACPPGSAVAAYEGMDCFQVGTCQTWLYENAINAERAIKVLDDVASSCL